MERFFGFAPALRELKLITRNCAHCTISAGQTFNGRQCARGTLFSGYVRMSLLQAKRVVARVKASFPQQSDSSTDSSPQAGINRPRRLNCGMRTENCRKGCPYGLFSACSKATEH